MAIPSSFKREVLPRLGRKTNTKFRRKRGNDRPAVSSEEVRSIAKTKQRSRKKRKAIAQERAGASSQYEKGDMLSGTRSVSTRLTEKKATPTGKNLRECVFEAGGSWLTGGAGCC